ncbi:hypothetical protein C2845_PM05G33230 [Panicum miliaceum]|uniref:Uncharacterized protein n=1 Tax=Panicum miliaceum TaxID=4540 RepID=A0A3L6T3P7_PANMI|nr:hypothetical protein C2845_PM05G33230 [Panicum miliaceum]
MLPPLPARCSAKCLACKTTFLWCHILLSSLGFINISGPSRNSENPCRPPLSSQLQPESMQASASWCYIELSM